MVSVLLMADFSDTGDVKKSSWCRKEHEIRSRLLRIPILLYHNIDGRGVFSVKNETLRQHFTFLRDNNIRVISLSELVENLECAKSFDDEVIVITFDDGFYSMYSRLMPLAVEFHYPVTLFIYTDFIYTRAESCLTWDKLAILEENGIAIEGHTLSHCDLTAYSKRNDYTARKRLFDEIYLSKRLIELYMGKDVKYFAFPYGRYDERIIELSQYAGYRRVFSTDYGSNIVTRDNYCLRRHHIKNSYSMKFYKELAE